MILKIENLHWILILEKVQTTLTILKATPFSFKIVPYFKCKQVIFYRGPFKYYVIMFLTFLDPPTHFFDDLQYSLDLTLDSIFLIETSEYCKSSKTAIF